MKIEIRLTISEDRSAQRNPANTRITWSGSAEVTTITDFTPTVGMYLGLSDKLKIERVYWVRSPNAKLVLDIAPLRSTRNAIEGLKSDIKALLSDLHLDSIIWSETEEAIKKEGKK